MDAATGNEGAKARAVISCLDATSMTWVANGGKGEIMELYDECMTAVRGDQRSSLAMNIVATCSTQRT